MLKVIENYPPILLVLSMIFLWMLTRMLGGVSYAALTPLALICFAVASILMLLAANTFRNHQTPIMPDRTANTLITSGVFKYSRNPIYLAMAVALLGFGIFLGAPLSLLIVPMFMWRVTKTHIFHEEHMLQFEFPEATKAYFTKTPRWIGPI
ncbi:MAG: methyltransferase family protein [Planktomarina sp.]